MTDYALLEILSKADDELYGHSLITRESLILEDGIDPIYQHVGGIFNIFNLCWNFSVPAKPKILREINSIISDVRDNLQRRSIETAFSGYSFEIGANPKRSGILHVTNLLPVTFKHFWQSVPITDLMQWMSPEFARGFIPILNGYHVGRKLEPLAPSIRAYYVYNIGRYANV